MVFQAMRLWLTAVLANGDRTGSVATTTTPSSAWPNNLEAEAQHMDQSSSCSTTDLHAEFCNICQLLHLISHLRQLYSSKARDLPVARFPRVCKGGIPSVLDAVCILLVQEDEILACTMCSESSIQVVRVAANPPGLAVPQSNEVDRGLPMTRSKEGHLVDVNASHLKLETDLSPTVIPKPDQRSERQTTVGINSSGYKVLDHGRSFWPRAWSAAPRSN